MNIPTNDDLEKMEKDFITFYEISCVVAPKIFDIILNCNFAKQIWDVPKNLYQGSKQPQDKKLKRFNLIIMKLSNVGTVQSIHETSLQFLNGIGRHWTTPKMIIQGDRKN